MPSYVARVAKMLDIGLRFCDLRNFFFSFLIREKLPHLCYMSLNSHIQAIFLVQFDHHPIIDVSSIREELV